MRGILICVVVMCSAVARADFILTGSEHREVTLPHDEGILFDSSTADIKDAGSVGNLYVNDASSVTVSTGSVGYLQSYNTSNVLISAGSVNLLKAHDSSTVAMSSGNITDNLYAYSTSRVVVSGGNIGGYLFAYGTSNVAISGGRIIYDMRAYSSSNVAISGGDIEGFLGAYDDSNMLISGGNITNLSANHDSKVTFYGYDFRVTGGLRLENERVLGTGILIGKWFDGTPWTVKIQTHHPNATITAIPEPGTLVMLLIALLGVVAWRRRG